MIENELKYVLSLNTTIPDNIKTNRSIITQVYLDNRARIRKTRERRNGIEYINHTFTYKYAVVETVGLEEINASISEQEYTRMERSGISSLTKTRYSFSIGDEKWDIDFFGPEGAVYFVLAECEMPEGRTAPNVIPEFVMDNLLLAVPRENSPQYTSFRLENEQYAREIYSNVNKETVN